MPRLSQQRCFNHAQREPVARCPECQRFYCRECVSEHETRLLCASCITSLTRQNKDHSPKQGWLLRIAAALGGALLIILLSYSAGRFMLSIPTSYHEGTIWKPNKLWSDSK